MQWVGAPSCQRGSYAFYKSVSSSTPPDGPVQVWRLGEFYFIRCGPQDPVCVAEVGHMVTWSTAVGIFLFYHTVKVRANTESPVGQCFKLSDSAKSHVTVLNPPPPPQVTLLWEDQTRRHLLASTRLYFLPEDTPKGRTKEHGEVGATFWSRTSTESPPMRVVIKLHQLCEHTHLICNM